MLMVQSLAAQTKPVSAKQINITLTPLKNCWVYLGSYYGNGRALVDSAYLNEKSMGVFKGPKKLTGGIYFVVSPAMTIQFEVLMDQKQQFSIVADTAQKEKAMITGSLDNDLFKTYTAFSTVKGKRMQELEAKYHQATTKADSTRLRNEIVKTDEELQAYRNDLARKIQLLYWPCSSIR